MARNSSGAAGIVVVGLLALLVAMCNGGVQRESPHSRSARAAVVNPVPLESPPSETTETQFVSASVLKQRSSPNGQVVGKLVGGEAVVVYEHQGEWARVSPAGSSAKWVSSRLLCSGSGCYQSTVKSSPTSREKYRPVHSNYLDAGCPYSGSRVCIGPRGGRYCITSGGNKRYGV